MVNYFYKLRGLYPENINIPLRNIIDVLNVFDNRNFCISGIKYCQMYSSIFLSEGELLINCFKYE